MPKKKPARLKTTVVREQRQANAIARSTGKKIPYPGVVKKPKGGKKK